MYRGQTLVVPSGTTRLQSGAAIVGFAGADARSRLIERLRVKPGDASAEP